MEVVEIVVGPKDSDEARAIALKVFGQAKQHGLGEMEFIPLIQNGFDVETYRSALKAHFEWCQQIVSVSIEGLKDPDKPFQHAGVKNTFRQIIELISGGDNKPMFIGFECTKDMTTKGRYLLLTTRDKIKTAQHELDQFFQYLKGNGKDRELASEGMAIRRTNNTFTSEETNLMDALAKKYGKKTAGNNPHRRQGNAWLSRKRTPEVIFTSDAEAEFPHLLATPAEKCSKSMTPVTQQTEQIDHD